MAKQPRILIIAGPNGAGKTTFSRGILASPEWQLPFLNADIIAAELSPDDPDRVAVQAGKMMLRQVDEHLKANQSFALETTLSGLTYARKIPKWREAGYAVYLMFLRVSDPEQSVNRVARRVQHGGHNIPTDVIHRRFHAGWDNFEKIYKPLVSYWLCYNADISPPVVADWGENL